MGIGQTVGKVLNNKSFLDDPHAVSTKKKRRKYITKQKKNKVSIDLIRIN